MCNDNENDAMIDEKVRVSLEVCAGDLESVRNAAIGGADRVELCMALDEGGLTPSAGMISEALKVEGIRVHVLIRPREGDFVYSPQEVDAMLTDVEMARRLGAHGVVIGALTADGEIDMDVCSRLVRVAGGMDVTFHRAFDRCSDAMTALEQVVTLGCSRLLTSGCAPSAHSGIDMLAELNRRGAGRISIMAGAGVCPENVAEILRCTGVCEVHASARELKQEAAGEPLVKMGANDGCARKVTSVRIVSAIREALTTV